MVVVFTISPHRFTPRGGGAKGRDLARRQGPWAPVPAKVKVSESVSALISILDQEPHKLVLKNREPRARHGSVGRPGGESPPSSVNTR
ncbi:hypothetical protein NHX12_021514 [Muraenolepis orangiensis]|uniref:Uncharacterized protein n=1 Tax=Muraenolepis orangiensis TaxID=630683 RepID=A0A9Q0IUF9_9TELE|nr:hypothetical protein NHX12_021514 [Muraenolepis orangiensis]